MLLRSLPILLCLAAGTLVAADAQVVPAADGWSGTVSGWTLVQITSPTVLVVRALVPREIGASQLTVSIDGTEQPSVACQPGAVEWRRILAGTPGERKIAIAWSAHARLPAPDGRDVAARIEHVALEPVLPGPSGWDADADVAGAGGPVAVGAGWYALESWQGQRFRWMGPSGEIGIAGDALGSDRVLTVTAEPGPGADAAQALRLVAADGRLLDKAELHGRAAIDLVVPATARALQPLHLEMAGSGKAPGDPRQLNLRVFSLVLQPEPAKH